ncbi:uncharacterized protein LAESUDRAFT_729815 [Laetiporus sulphureus 93-53]|uniref:Uncharacterized protein n=1 Tax=Laetiporus sulphureus 93-53 TaxID=1314785 RepID=A0A165CHU7_9APHY|nr:uncharacterized protein LAESUDRAFT_729815 [Laetiporus sulphureus 93-53]KZT02844.1 hypothetical protein LAESUDRAFT_729815 [Laetiporus sulphureus 93-53]
MSLSAWEGGLIATRVSAIIPDIIVIAVTWHRSYVMRASRLAYPTRDGSLYFIVLVMVNVAQLTVVYLSGEDADEAAFIVNVLSSIFVSRFLLNLRKVQVSVDDSLSDTSDPSDSVDDMQQSVSQLSTLVPFPTSMLLDTRFSAISSLNATGRDETSINGDENVVVDPNLRDLETRELCKATLASHA